MLELVKERAEALFSKLNTSVTVKRKQTLWEDIATSVNASGKTQRPTQKGKKMWSDLRLNAIRLRSPPPEILCVKRKKHVSQIILKKTDDYSTKIQLPLAMSIISSYTRYCKR